MIKDRYINIFTEFGFKKIFGEEQNKDILIDFLNEMLKKSQGKIKKISHLKRELFGNTFVDNNLFFDLYCEDEKGETFIVEIQAPQQENFKDRAVFNSTFLIDNLENNNYYFEIKYNKIYTINILDFIYDEEKEFIHYIKFADDSTNKFYFDFITLIFIEVPKFNKTIEQCNEQKDKWIYILKNLHNLKEIPKELNDSIFNKLFKVAELENLNESEYIQYENSIKSYMEKDNKIITA